MLAGSGLGDDPGLAHAAGQQDLADTVVDLVRAGVVQVLALEIDLRPAEMVGQALGEIERRGSAHIMGQQAIQLGLEGGVFLGGQIGGLQVQHQRHQGFGHIAAAELAEPAVGVRIGGEVVGRRRRRRGVRRGVHRLARPCKELVMRGARRPERP